MNFPHIYRKINNVTVHAHCRLRRNHLKNRYSNPLVSYWRSSSAQIPPETQSGTNTKGSAICGLGNPFHVQSVRCLSRFSPKVLLEKAPPSFKIYLKLIRFDKPIGTLLLFWPCTWSIGLSATSGQLPSFYVLSLFGLGSFFMRGAGCIVNDMWDKDFDKKVARTRERPLASNQLTDLRALTYLAGHLSVSLAILLQFNMYSIILGMSSLGLVVIYPLMKRYTYWPQVFLGISLNWGVLIAWSTLHGFLDATAVTLYISLRIGMSTNWLLALILSASILLVGWITVFSEPDSAGDVRNIGLTFNWGAMLGWSAVQGSCDWSVVLPLYVSAIAWTLMYDTIYAHQDKDDDILIGVKSTALKFDDQTKYWLSGFSGLMVSGLLATGVMAEQAWPYYTGVALVAAHLSKQIYTVDLDSPDDCGSKFKSNSHLGALMFASIVVGTLLKGEVQEPQEQQ